MAMGGTAKNYLAIPSDNRTTCPQRPGIETSGMLGHNLLSQQAKRIPGVASNWKSRTSKHRRVDPAGVRRDYRQTLHQDRAMAGKHGGADRHWIYQHTEI